jgi:hypothetical protein
MVYSLLGHIALVRQRLKGPSPPHASTQHSRVTTCRPIRVGPRGRTNGCGRVARVIELSSQMRIRRSCGR